MRVGAFVAAMLLLWATDMLDSASNARRWTRETFGFALGKDRWAGEAGASSQAAAGGGIVIGAHGQWYGVLGEDEAQQVEPTAADAPTVQSIMRLDPSLPHSKTAESLLAGLLPFPENDLVLRMRHGEDAWREIPPSDASLGKPADDVYYLGSPDLADYRRRLEAFIEVGLPAQLRHKAHEALDAHLGAYRASDSGAAPSGLGVDEDSRKIWMTDRDRSRLDSESVKSWRNNPDGWKWNFMDDHDADFYVDTAVRSMTVDGETDVDLAQEGTPRIAAIWDALPKGILRSDMLRYLLMYLEGGVYTDVDTRLIRPISTWGRGTARLWNNGRDWLAADDDDEPSADSLSRPSVIVGVEADVGTRADWHDWWARPIQIAQWTLSSTAFHPIYLDTLMQIARQTAAAYDWQAQKSVKQKALLAAGFTEQAYKLRKAALTDEPDEMGPLGIIHWTGPGVFTDSVLRYLALKHGVKWTDLRGMQTPLRVGDVTILPSTGFSPGVGLHGAQGIGHPEAMVEHEFAGTWKNQA